MIKTISFVLIVGLCIAVNVVKADFTISEPANLGSTVNSSADDWNPSISADGLSLYYCSLRPGGYGNLDLWVTRRETTEDDWATPVNLGPTVNSSSHDYSPDLSADGLMLHFASNRPGGYGGHDEWVTTRATVSDPWGSPVNLGSTVNGSTYEGCPSISADGLMLFFNSDRPGGHGGWDIWVTTRTTVSDPWGTPVNLGPTVNSSAREHCTDILAEGLSLFFVSERSGGTGSTDLWLTTRPTISDPWRPPVNLGPTVNSAGRDTGPIFSADGSTLYFSSDRPGGVGSVDLWRVSIIPIVDLSGDGIVDSTDMVIMIDHWGTDNSLCDIGPMPWGDGIIDVQDLIVLAEHLFEEVPPVE